MAGGAAVPFTFSVVTNEVSDDLGRVVGFAAELGLRGVEIQDVWGVPVERADTALLARARAEIDQAGLKVVMVGAPTFKTLIVAGANPADLPAIPGWHEHLSQLEGSFRAARLLGCERVRVFSCRREEMVGLGNPSPRRPDGGDLPSQRLEAVRAVLLEAARRAEDQGVTLCLENVRSCFGNSGRNTVAILEAVDHPRVRAIWDPANDFVSGGDGYLQGYESMKPWMVHVHVKDAAVRDHATGLTSWEAVGRGEVDYVGQFTALLKDGYEGAVSLETHWHPEGRSREQNSRESFAGTLEAIRAAQLRVA